MFTVLNGGCNARHPSSFFMSRPKGLHHYVLLIIKSPANFNIHGKSFVTKPGSAVLIDRNTPYQYHNPDGDYTDDWLHLDCIDDEPFRNSGIIFNEIITLRNPAKFTLYLQQLLWERNYTSELFRDDNVNMLLQLLMNNLILACKEKDMLPSYSPYYTKLQNIRLSLQATPYTKYSAEGISELLGISASYFQHLYTVFFGISFQADLINMRVEYAKNLIISSNLTIDQISQMCGYSNEIHFYRQFRKKTGMTPLEYRKSQM